MRFFLALFILILTATLSHANSAQLAWDASPSFTPEACAVETCVYIVYYGSDPASPDYIKPVGNVLTTEIAQLPPGEWFFTVTAAFDGIAESDPSNVVSAVYEGFSVPAPVEHPPINIPMSPGATLTININIVE